MKEPIDNFSEQSKLYSKYRPVYPNELYRKILQHVKHTERCWDCATGNGQVASALVQHFDQVFATDISKEQLSNAEKDDDIEYSIQRAEKTSFRDNSFDCITVAQAAHWFDLSAFASEVQRVAKKRAILAIWGYGLLRFDDATDNIINTFYHDVVGPYWDEERRHLDHEYETIRFDFEEVLNSKEFSIKKQWTLPQLKGFLNTWSAVQHYKRDNNNQNPVDEVIQHLGVFWDDDEIKEVRFPLYLKIWRV
ncbi:MAG: methyltransferase domain-containing protein [Balneolaceae bacterium]|nr:methyltransferase domain-containing protein [Balneolaceae bacterium]